MSEEPGSRKSSWLTRYYSALLSRCSRITSTGNLIPEIDGLRFIAILGVVVFHCALFIGEAHLPKPLQLNAFTGTPWVRLACTGFIGVQIFFVISGFILSLPFAEAYQRGAQTPRLKHYFLRRIARLEPPYIIHWAIICILLLAFRGGHAVAQLWPDLVTGVTYTHYLILGTPNSLSNLTWSMEVEVQFYIVAPLFFHVFRIHHAAWRRLLLLGIVLIYPCLFDLEKYRLSLVGQLPFFITGILLADFYVLGNWRSKAKRWEFDVLFFSALAALHAYLYWQFENARAPYGIVVPILILLLEAGALRGIVAGKLLSISTITVIGGMCYSIYLYHEMVLSRAGRVAELAYHPNWSFTTNYLIEMLLILPAILICCTIFFVLFERPFMRKFWWRRVISDETAKIDA